MEQNKQQLTIGKEQSVQHKNYIIQAINSKKIRDYEDSQKKSASSNLINYLLSLLGISMVANDGKEMHYIVLEEFISDSLSHYTFEEIKLAFKNLLKGDYNNIQVYNKLDSILVGKVMRAFDAQKKYAIQQERNKKHKESMSEYTPSKEEIEFKMSEAVDRVKKEFEQHKSFSGTVTHIYDWLDSQGKMPTEKSYKIRLFEQAKQIAREKVGEPKSLSDHKNLKKELDKINNGNNTVKTIAKRLALENYFIEQLKNKL